MMPDFAWMAWTWQTGVFFALLGAVLAGMTLLAARWPEAPRVGILRFPTTRGDRLFVTLLAAAFIHILWIGLVGGDLWPAGVISVLFGAVMFRWA
jgi:predicted small integral membrane protein